MWVSCCVRENISFPLLLLCKIEILCKGMLVVLDSWLVIRLLRVDAVFCELLIFFLQSLLCCQLIQLPNLMILLLILNNHNTSTQGWECLANMCNLHPCINVPFNVVWGIFVVKIRLISIGICDQGQRFPRTGFKYVCFIYHYYTIDHIDIFACEVLLMWLYLDCDGNKLYYSMRWSYLKMFAYYSCWLFNYRDCTV